MIVACFSSTPESMVNAEASIRSILGQTRVPDVIRWHLPEFSVRMNVPYPAVPEWFSQYSDKVELIRCEDSGPSTKVLPLLDTLDKDDRVLIFDDDAVYADTAVENLIKAAKDKAVAVGFVGVPFIYVPFVVYCRKAFGKAVGKISWFNRVGVLLGSGMMLVPSKAFDGAEQYRQFMSKDERYFKNDDLIIAHFCHENGIPMYAVPGDPNRFHTENETRLSYTNKTGETHSSMALKGEVSWYWAETVAIVLLLITVAMVLFLVLKP